MVRWFLCVSVALVASSCSSTQWSKWSNQSVDDDLYYVSSGEAARRVDIRAENRSSQAEPEDPYEAYLQARKGKNSGISPYDPNEAAYDRTMRRHADPFWSNPSLGMGFGMGGFFGGRNYMLFNPYFPPFWSMQPGISLGWNSMNGMNAGLGWGMGWGMNSPWGFGGMDPWMMGMNNPWMMGMYDPWMGTAWGNPWGNPWGWNNGWHQPGWGGGWQGNPGNDPANRLATAPPRTGSRMGGSLPQQPSLFNPNPGRNGQVGGTGTSASRNVNADDSRFQSRTASPRNSTVREVPAGSDSRQGSGRTVITESRPTQTPQRSRYDESSPRRTTPGQFESRPRPESTPSRSFDNGRNNWNPPSRSNDYDRGSWSTPSRGGGSEATPFRGGGSGGGGGRPSGGGNPGRPR